MNGERTAFITGRNLKQIEALKNALGVRPATVFEKVFGNSLGGTALGPIDPSKNMGLNI